MSYSFGMFFKPVATFSGALKKAHEFTEQQGSFENLKKLLEDELYYFPSQRSRAETEREKSFLRIADNCALDGFCTLNFVYFHEAKLLALVGYRYPYAKKFFKMHFGFQNSCDQDYKREDWKGIKLFENIWDECAQMTAEEIVAYEKSVGYDDYTAEYFAGEKELNYFRRSVAYDKIYRMLGLNDWLWGKNNPKFTRFSMCILTSTEKKYEANNIAKHILREQT